MSALRSLALTACVALLPLTAQGQAKGISPDGQVGTIHKVVPGDTLWDITASYVGTPWAWPSLWKENAGIVNPHLIEPGDLIWITEGEMRKLTPEEAEAFLAAAREPDEPAPAPIPAAPAPEEEKAARGPEPDPFASLDSGTTGGEIVVSVPDLARYAFVTAEEYAQGGGAIMGTHEPQYWSAQHQTTIVGVGEGEAHVGDSFTVFRVRRRLLHPETREMLGYFVQVLGRAEITEIHPESAFVQIVTAYGEVQPGDRVVPYKEVATSIKETFSADSVVGEIVAYQPYRLRSGAGDLVIVDRGTADGIAPGRRVELYRAGKEARDPLTYNKVLVPDYVVGQAFVIKASSRTSLALVLESRTDLLVGDRFRTN